MNFGEWLDSLGDTVSGYAGELSSALDFGFRDTNDSIDYDDYNYNRINPEVDATEIERANPTDTNFAPIMGMPAPVFYLALGILSIVLLRATKII